MAKKYPKVSIFNPIRLWKYLFKEPVTIPFEDIMTKKNADYLNKNSIIKDKKRLESSPREGADNLRGFHTNDWEDCIGCATCEEICPTEAITMVERLDVDEKAGELQQRPVIDYGRCCFCALCVDTCTTGSLKMSKEYIYANINPDDFIIMPEATWQGEEVKEGWIKDENSDLLDLKRVDMVHENIDERKKGFVEIVRGYSKEYAKMEAARCVECGVCTSSCPVQMHIPEYIKAIWEDDIEGALRQIYETNPLPGVCGRVCTHNCETSCAIAVRGEAIAIRWLKRYIIDSAPTDMYEKIINEPVSEVIDAKIAVVGSGPAGLGAAYYLKVMGYKVDVFEEKELTGGVMRYGIPAYRLPDSAIDKDINFIKSIGVNIQTNTRVGKDITMDQLEKDYDAVFLGTGFFKPRNLNIPGSENKGVIGAMDFLPQVREYERGNLKLEDIDVAKSVIVIGGGDVAFDVARSATRLQMLKYGKSNVKLTSLENADMLPASADEVIEGAEEGVEFLCGNGPQEIMISKKGNVEGLRLWKCLCIIDKNGKFNPEFDSDCEMIIDGEQVYIAIGQSPDYDYIPKSFQDTIEISRGKIKANEQGQVEKLDWLFVGGDIFRGPDLISGVADGHRSAQAIDEYLYKKSKKNKTKKTVSKMKEAVKFNTPELTPKQRGIK
ncbi:FAD-dependent pyridine nucleotide-disulfide oxidoreductase [Candidatus Izimaplasma bacterium HR1]|jgi:glutamate synthase (NADPH/NADH) small chain|uniref:FAD-dependent oxidoreductase n=1 Tax=Candidatus Izimoplasma sp. HR1 TaxID=1541959 RepID=UPI0004F6564E|nr:FAD-dependent pyridine nucleotide-disulfide oxidoreductase [Candidatus Izimaplasma bacterium HR1]